MFAISFDCITELIKNPWVKKQVEALQDQFWALVCLDEVADIEGIFFILGSFTHNYRLLQNGSHV